ncbi:hypothetical protein TNCV_4350061 [Trichonephila clavipes]|nr:hypothetical protein TNCV_4350061 [Trichonephila clavipes]
MQCQYDGIPDDSADIVGSKANVLKAAVSVIPPQPSAVKWWKVPRGFYGLKQVELETEHMALGDIVHCLDFGPSGSVVLMGWTKPHCLCFDRVCLTRHNGASKTAGTLDRFNVHRCPTRRVFSGTGLEPVTKQATVRYLYHSATAATRSGEKKEIGFGCFTTKKKKTQLSTSAENSAAAPKHSTTVPEHSAVPENSTAVPENSDVVSEKNLLTTKIERLCFSKSI